MVRDSKPLSVADRKAFAEQGFGAPVGVALESKGKTAWFLPADIVDFRAGTNLQMLHVVCRDAGLGIAAWREPAVTVWRLRTVGFVNASGGSRYALASPRGLTPLGEPTLARLLRSVRLAGRYLVAVRRENGSFLTYWDAASGLRGGCDSVAEQAAAAGALAELCELRPREEYLNACYESLSYLMQFTNSDPQNPRMAFTGRQEVCRLVWELEASAQVLEAMCRYRAASGLTEPDDWIAALAEFLLFMQLEDGSFDLQYDAESGTHTTPEKGVGQVVPQAKAALALCLAYRELNVLRFLDGARRALKRLMEGDQSRSEPYSAHEARWLVSALLECSAFLSGREYQEWAGRIAAARREVQLAENGAPADDLIGGTGSALPPKAGPTADDLVVFASVCMMKPEAESEAFAAARRAGRYLMGLQYLEENSYYLPDPAAGRGGFREQPGANIIRLQTLESALRGLVKLTRLELQGRSDD